MTKKNTNISHVDLVQPSKFTNDEQKFLKRIFIKFSEEVQVVLSSLLHTKAVLKLAQIKLCRYQTYKDSLREPSCLITFKPGNDFRGIIFVDLPLGFAMIDKLMGGKGESLETIRQFTDLEQTIINRVFLKIVDSFSLASREFVEISSQYETLEFNPVTVNIVSPSENVVIVSFQARIAHTIGLIEICLPFRFLKSIVPKDSFDQFLHVKSSDSIIQPPVQAVSPMFTRGLEAAKIPVSVEIGSVEVIFQELLKIEAGDFIKLDTAINQSLKIKINNKAKFLGRPGMKESKVAVQISKVLTEGDEEFED